MEALVPSQVSRVFSIGILGVVTALEAAGCHGAVVDSVGEEHHCTLIGCIDGANIQFSLDKDTLVTSGTKLEACRNDTCFTWKLDAVAVPVEVGVGTSLPSADDTVDPNTEFPLKAFISRTQTGYRFDVTLSASTKELHDGDVYHAKLVAASDEIIIERMAAVTYTAFAPNGPGCGPACTYASVQL